ncbi:MAG: UbiA family prenyltransferase, partial [Sulfurovum sp.]|nr:UbiA family prenyltransferase [Sulfurovum sp.]
MIKDFFVVTKFVLSFAVSLSALFGYIMAKGDVGFDMFIATFAVLLVAMGVSTLNQVQEYKEDSKMDRTKNRPIASGRMTPRTGMVIAGILIVLSMILIYDLLGLTGVNLFLFAFIWYNALYTPLKKKSALAVVPGAILGVIPPAIGWLTAGHSLMELEFISLGLFYFIWQVPHFW